uniref:Uncharacterized protein n=1 Tax=Triticum urartu TaxID=4572 RepID=A0A8R7QVY2_TRIUA
MPCIVTQGTKNRPIYSSVYCHGTRFLHSMKCRQHLANLPCLPITGYDNCPRLDVLGAHLLLHLAHQLLHQPKTPCFACNKQRRVVRLCSVVEPWKLLNPVVEPEPQVRLLEAPLEHHVDNPRRVHDPQAPQPLLERQSGHL